MPHVTIEYSSNAIDRSEIVSFCRAVKQAMMASDLFELGAVRVRAVAFDSFAIADENPENAFIDVSVRIGLGRSEAEKKKLGESLFASMSELLLQRFETPYFALSLEIREIDPALSWKKNTMHARLRGK